MRYCRVCGGWCRVQWLGIPAVVACIAFAIWAGVTGCLPPPYPAQESTAPPMHDTWAVDHPSATPMFRTGWDGPNVYRCAPGWDGGCHREAFPPARATVEVEDCRCTAPGMPCPVAIVTAPTERAASLGADRVLDVVARGDAGCRSEPLETP